MLEAAFSFEGRLKRLPFFLLVLASGLALAVAFFVIAMALMVAAARHNLIGLLIFGVALLVVGIAALWCSLSLHVRRIRDIGWDPAIVIVSWVIVNVADKLVLVRLLPTLALHPALGHGQLGTYLGLTVNAVLSLALLFVPGRDDDSSRSIRSERVVPPAVPSMSRPARAGGPKEFGRRGLV